MKNLYIIFLLLFSAVVNSQLSAQEPGKRFYIEGDLSFTHQKNLPEIGTANYNEMSTIFGMVPNLGYMLRSNLMVGIGFHFQQGKQVSRSELTYPFQSISYVTYSEIISKEMAPVIFSRYMFPLGEKMHAGLELNLMYGMSGSKVTVLNQSNPSSDSSGFTYGTRYFQASLSPELHYLVSKGFGIKVSFNIMNLRYTKQQQFATERRSFSYEFDLNPTDLSIGIFYNFGRPI